MIGPQQRAAVQNIEKSDWNKKRKKRKKHYFVPFEAAAHKGMRRGPNRERAEIGKGEGERERFCRNRERWVKGKRECERRKQKE